jgi:dienelactone hydrolase
MAIAIHGISVGSLLAAGTPTDWPKLVQEPYMSLPADAAKLSALPADADGWKARREEIMRAWLTHLGPCPEAAPLDPRVESEETIGGIRRLLVSFATEGLDRCRAYLLLPAGYEPGQQRPAAVVFHQTTLETLNEPVGKGTFAFAVELTRRGYVTLSPECYIMKDQGPREKYAQTWGPSFQADKLLKRRPGWTGMGKMTFDAGRCVDYLETRPEVDPRRIAACGFSLGAKETLYALAFEPRFAAGVFMEGGIGLKMSNWLNSHYLTGFPADKIGEREHHELLALIAPRPFLVIGADDGTGRNSNACDGLASWPFVKAALPVYRALGAGDRLGFYGNGLNRHDMNQYSKDLAWNWIDQWLNVGHPENLYVPHVVFTETDQSNTPGKWTHTIVTAKLSGAAFDRVVTVPFVVEGAAKAGVDYTMGSSPLTIPAGSNSAAMVVTILNQAVFETPVPSVVVKMGPPVNTTVGETVPQKYNSTWCRKGTLLKIIVNNSTANGGVRRPVLAHATEKE